MAIRPRECCLRNLGGPVYGDVDTSLVGSLALNNLSMMSIIRKWANPEVKTTRNKWSIRIICCYTEAWPKILMILMTRRTVGPWLYSYAVWCLVNLSSGEYADTSIFVCQLGFKASIVPFTKALTSKIEFFLHTFTIDHCRKKSGINPSSLFFIHGFFCPLFSRWKIRLTVENHVIKFDKLLFHESPKIGCGWYL